jgi:hypothetical protein
MAVRPHRRLVWAVAAVLALIGTVGAFRAGSWAVEREQSHHSVELTAASGGHALALGATAPSDRSLSLHDHRLALPALSSVTWAATLGMSGLLVVATLGDATRLATLGLGRRRRGPPR